MRRLPVLCFLLLAIHFVSFGQKKDSLDFRKNPILTDRYGVNLGFFSISKSVKMNVDGTFPNNPIDFGETLGLGKQENTFALGFNWRFSKQKKWSFGAEYFSENNTRTAVLESEVDWGDTQYPAGVLLESGFDFQMFGIWFGRVISMGDKHELLGGIGVHTMNVRTFVQGKAYLGNFDFELDTDKKRVDVIAPIPSLGLRYIYAPHYRWNLMARVDWFSISIGDYSGTLWNLAPSASFHFTDHFGIGLGYKYFQTKFKFEKNLYRGRANLLYQGPLFSVFANF